MQERIIEFVRSNPFVYDTNHNDYKNREAKDRLWAELGQEMSVPVKNLKKKWKNIRDRYYRLHKMNKTRAAASGRKSRIAQKYKFFEHLQFLNGCDTFTKSISGSLEQEPWFEQSYEAVMVEADERGAFTTSNLSVHTSSTPRSAGATSEGQQRAAGSTGSLEQEVVKALRLIEEKSTPTKLFMESMAARIDASNLSTRRVMLLQAKIMKLVQSDILRYE